MGPHREHRVHHPDLATSAGQQRHGTGMRVFHRRTARPQHIEQHGEDRASNARGMGTGTDGQQEKMEQGDLPPNGGGRANLPPRPTHDDEGYPLNYNGHRVTRGIQPDGESGRTYIHPWHFLRICWNSGNALSKWTNVLWPFTIAAIILRFGFRGHDHESDVNLWVFITAYIGMVPAANLLGFAGEELARKIPKVAGVILETTLGSVVEIILFMVLIAQGNNSIPVIKAAILGSILANMLLCLGLCFFVGGIFHPQQVFHEAISEVGSNLMLVAGMGLIIPTIYYNSLINTRADIGDMVIEHEARRISRATAIVLLVAFIVYIWFQSRSHHNLYEDILEADEERDHDGHLDLVRPKLTLTESLVAIVIAIAFVALMAVLLVEQIDYIVHHRGISDAFLGLILVPVVEKASEHITAVDEAFDNQMNYALAHVLGASIQTALLNTPLVVIVGWGLDMDMSLNFELFDAVVLILAIIVVGNFLRDEKSDYLEGALCVFVYILIAVSAFFYPNPREVGEPTSAATANAAFGMARL